MYLVSLGTEANSFVCVRKGRRQRGRTGRGVVPMRWSSRAPLTEAITVPAHPQRVRPLGDLLLLDNPGERSLREMGSLGTLGQLPDEVLLQILGYCAARDLCQLAGVSHAFRVFSLCEDLWRARVLEEWPTGTPLRYVDSWRQTWLFQWADTRIANSVGHSSANLYSDMLFISWFCGNASMPRSWLTCENIERVAAAALSIGEFAERYERPGIPVVLTGLVTQWPAFLNWSLDEMRKRCGDKYFHVGGYDMKLGACPASTFPTFPCALVD